MISVLATGIFKALWELVRCALKLLEDRWDAVAFSQFRLAPTSKIFSSWIKTWEEVKNQNQICWKCFVQLKGTGDSSCVRLCKVSLAFIFIIWSSHLSKVQVIQETHLKVSQRTRTKQNHLLISHESKYFIANHKFSLESKQLCQINLSFFTLAYSVQ